MGWSLVREAIIRIAMTAQLGSIYPLTVSLELFEPSCLWNCKSHVTNAKWAFFPFSFIEEFAGYEMTFATSATRSSAIKGGPIQHEVTRVGDKYG